MVNHITSEPRNTLYESRISGSGISRVVLSNPDITIY